MSSSSDMTETGSCSRSSSSCSVENVTTTPDTDDTLSIFSFIALSHHHHEHSCHNSSGNLSRSPSDLSLRNGHSPDIPHCCGCNHSNSSHCVGFHSMSPCNTLDLKRCGDESLFWKCTLLQKLIGEEESRKCNCQFQHPSQPHSLCKTNYIQLLSKGRDGLLLKSLEKGVLFPLIHWSSKMNENYPLPLHLTPIPNLHFNQGIYRELKRVIPPEAWLQQEGDPFDDLGSSKELQFGCQGTLRSSMSPLCPVGSSRKPTTWLVIGYKSLEKTLDSSLEATWKEWTGARHVYLHLRSDFEIRRISFFHRAYPIDNLDLFMYVVVMEIGNVDDRNRIWLLDFVQRMRAERMKGFVTVYSEIDEEVSCIENEYLKYKNATSPTGIHPPLRTHFHQTPPPPKTAPASLGHDTNPLTLSQHLLESQSAEINGNIKFMENLLAEIRKAQIGEYF